MLVSLVTSWIFYFYFTYIFGLEELISEVSSGSENLGVSQSVWFLYGLTLSKYFI